mgnify:CR=1 FL=1
MLRRRRLLLTGVMLVVAGSLGATAGYGLHLRSDRYLRRTQAQLSAFFELPCDIGGIAPLTFSSRLFSDVTVWLPDRRDPVFRCAEAVWHEGRDRGQTTCRLELSRGTFAIASDAWGREDYARVLRSGLGHDFDAIRLDEVRLHDFAVEFRHDMFRLDCRRADGVITFGDNGDSLARLSAAEFNGVLMAEPVLIAARFSPERGVVLHEVVLTLPEIPLANVGIDGVLRTRLTRGRFSGRVEYTQDDGPAARVAGRLSDLSLEEVTRGMEIGPLRGVLDVAVDDMRIADRLVTHLAARGQLSDLRLEDVGRMIGEPRLRGRADLNLRAVDAALGHLNRLAFDGVVTEVPIEPLCAMLGQGAMTGELAVRINALRVVRDEIEWADIEIDASPPAGRIGTIDRELLMTGVRGVLGEEWTARLPVHLLPEQIEYAQCGVRLNVRNNRLRVLGTHGPARDQILTLRVLGQELPVVRTLRREFDLTPVLREWRDAVASKDPRRWGPTLRNWWSATQPNGR